MIASSSFVIVEMSFVRMASVCAQAETSWGLAVGGKVGGDCSLMILKR